jgi:hypothetical protein
MYAIVINGKIQTDKVDEFAEGFYKLIDATNSEFFGKIDRYQIAEYVDYQKVEAITVDSNAEV